MGEREQQQDQSDTSDESEMLSGPDHDQSKAIQNTTPDTMPGPVIESLRLLTSPEFFESFPLATPEHRFGLQQALGDALRYVNIVNGPNVSVDEVFWSDHALALERHGIKTVAQLELAFHTGQLGGPSLGSARLKRIRYHLDEWYRRTARTNVNRLGA